MRSSLKGDIKRCTQSLVALSVCPSVIPVAIDLLEIGEPYRNFKFSGNSAWPVTGEAKLTSKRPRVKVTENENVKIVFSAHVRENAEKMDRFPSNQDQMCTSPILHVLSNLSHPWKRSFCDICLSVCYILRTGYLSFTNWNAAESFVFYG